MKNLKITTDGSCNIELVAGHFTVNITNNQNETFQQSSATTLEWSGTLLDGASVTYEKAEAAVKALGDGWRLPTRFELESILDLSRHAPATDTEKFPDTESRYYWTSTPCAWNSFAVWAVDFSYGLAGQRQRSYSACVRAVRSSQ